MQISKNFVLEEFTKSMTATRFGIKNIPNKEELINLEDLCYEILEPCRAFFQKPIRISSGFRSLSLNQKLGSSDTSQHISGKAVDFEINGVSNMVVACWLRDNVNFDQLILEYYTGEPNSGWIHISFDSKDTNRKEVLVFDGKSYKPNLPDKKIINNNVVDLSKKTI